MALARTVAIATGLVVVTMASSCRSPRARQQLTLAQTFKDHSWRLVAAREGSSVALPDGDVIAHYDSKTGEFLSQGFGNYYGMVATPSPDGDFTWGAVTATLIAVPPALARAGERYTKLVQKTHHASITAAGVALESNDGTTALEYHRIMTP
jgi:hypothetical protein